MIARFRASAAVIALVTMAATPALAQLSRAESRMVATVDAEHDQMVALLERLVNQNSGTRNLAGVEKVAATMRAELEPLGFTVEWQDQSSVGRAGHLVATKAGKPGTKKLLAIAHLDTVFEPDSPFQTFKRLSPTRAEGPGIGDNKGGMVVIVAALRAMQAAGTLKDAAIEIHMTGDEEDAGEPTTISRASLIAAGKRADVALDFEGLSTQDGQDIGSIARRSSNSWTLKTTGREGHSSGIFSAAAGDGAIYEITRIIARFRAELPEPSLTFNVGLIAGGATTELDADGIRASATGKSNIIPALAVAKGDFRTINQAQTDRVRAKMQAIVADHAPQTTATISFEDGYPPMAATEGNRTLLVALNRVNKDMGLPEMGELDPLRRGAADISFVAPFVDGLNGMGAGGSGAHAPGETVDLDSIKRQAKRAAILMTRLSREPSTRR